MKQMRRSNSLYGEPFERPGVQEQLDREIWVSPMTSFSQAVPRSPEMIGVHTGIATCLGYDSQLLTLFKTV